MDKITVFLSHSHKDVDIVRKIRDILETLNCEPLMFYLKCFDDENDEILESFIQKEIMARNIFVYCKSDNSEKSKWVQKELNVIKSLDEKRLYTIDIDDFAYGVIGLLTSIAELLRKNKVFVYGQYYDDTIKIINDYLVNMGYSVEVMAEDLSHIENIPDQSKITDWQWQISEFNKYKEFLLPTLTQKQAHINERIDKIKDNGIIIPIVTKSSGWATDFIFNNVLTYIFKHAKYVCPVLLDEKKEVPFKSVAFDKNNPEYSLKEIYRIIKDI